jgi:hypothetical protein
MCGFNPACIFVLPMLGRESGKYPRFRDCFITDDRERILVYTRVGGGNRACGFGEEELYKDPYFVRTYDDDSDSTYGYYEFNVPDKWKADFDCIVEADFKSVSDEYVEYVKGFYPELAKKGVIDSLFERGNQDPDQEGD